MEKKLFWKNVTHRITRLEEEHSCRFSLASLPRLPFWFTEFMYQSNQSFNIPPGNPPPGHLNFWNFFLKFLAPRAKKVIKCRHSRGNYLIIQNKEPQVSLAHGWKKVGWDAFSCWTKYSKCFASNTVKTRVWEPSARFLKEPAGRNFPFLYPKIYELV